MVLELLLKRKQAPYPLGLTPTVVVVERVRRLIREHLWVARTIVVPVVVLVMDGFVQLQGSAHRKLD